jgi:hypothetical protein
MVEKEDSDKKDRLRTYKDPDKNEGREGKDEARPPTVKCGLTNT